MVAKKPEQLDPNSPETTAGAALQGYDAMYRALFENMLDVYYRTDIDGHIEVISPSCLPQTGYSQEELIGRKTTEFYADPVQRDALLNELAKRGRVNDFDITLVHKNGTTRVASVTSHLVPGKDGRPSGVEGILRDVTARKHAENQLLNLNARLESTSDLLQEIIASIPVAIFWKDRDSRFLGCNQRFALDAGYSSPEEMIGKTDADMVWKDQASLYRADDAAVMAELFRGLLRIGVRPYYLHQMDLARGTGHFRTRLETGMEIMAALRGRVSGLAIPHYVIDLPGGKGKAPLLPNYGERREGELVIEGLGGEKVVYRDDPPWG